MLSQVNLQSLPFSAGSRQAREHAAREMFTVKLTDEQITTFNRDGFLCLPRITTDAEIAEIRDAYDRLFAERRGEKSGEFCDVLSTDGAAQKKDKLLQHIRPSKAEPKLRNTIFEMNAKTISRQLLGSGAERVFDHAMMKPARYGAATPWHQDEAYYDLYTNYQSITFWMPLQDVDAASGCLRYVPGSHHGVVVKHDHVGDDPRAHGIEVRNVDPATAVDCPLPAGGMVVHHRRTLHSAGPNTTDQPRRAFAVGFGVKSRAFTVREDFPWNAERTAARLEKKRQSTHPLLRWVDPTAKWVKSVVR